MLSSLEFRIPAPHEPPNSYTQHHRLLLLVCALSAPFLTLLTFAASVRRLIPCFYNNGKVFVQTSGENTRQPLQLVIARNWLADQFGTG